MTTAILLRIATLILFVVWLYLREVKSATLVTTRRNKEKRQFNRRDKLRALRYNSSVVDWRD